MDLFSGIGGNSLGLREYIKTIAYCENNKYAQSVLLSRMSEGMLELAPIWDDVKTLKKKDIKHKIDIIVGGFPCQDLSLAGLRKGLEGERSGLFYEIVRLANEIKPSFIFLENVPGVRTKGLRQVVGAFTEMGYDCRWTHLSASNIGAHHKRERWFFIAYASSEGLQRQRDRAFKIKKTQPFVINENENMANSECNKSRQQQGWGPGKSRENTPYYLDRTQWFSEPTVDRVVDGLSIQNRVDRVKCLGNAVVPLQAKIAFEKLLGLTK